ncbi:FG-GAP and VCBS repeat-containing protein [Streptomyces kebangsaanensis]|uniref:FG-GAP and VCBS repeat-containing protein n=1 Tax=Streptomyces kebangsaanensis TaxID=864058 RepID=UPI00093A1C75|nr:FG-GAP and VCBS repeat-containing protein [Streptomyces kebangsaanensis]
MGWPAGGVVVALGAGVVTYATASAPGRAGPGRPQEYGREPAVRTVRLADQGAGRRSLPRQDTERFSAALLTWDDPHAELRGRAEVRARSARTGQWSHWQTLPDSRFQGREAGSRGGTWNVRLTGGATTSGGLTTATGPVAHLDAATGDFNGDGYADAVLTYRDSGGIGRVARFTGSAADLTESGMKSVRGGRSVAAGDINGDGYDDLVIGRPHPSESGGTPGGHIAVLLGSAEGLATTGAKVVRQDTVGVAGADRSGDAFGFSVSVGDFDADGSADILVGAPGEDFTRDGVDRADAGRATLLRGTPSGPTVTGSFTVCQDTPGILDATEKGDRFGSSVSLTDLSGHGRAGLVIGSGARTRATASCCTRPSTAPASASPGPSRCAAPPWARPPGPASGRHCHPDASAPQRTVTIPSQNQHNT